MSWTQFRRFFPVRNRLLLGIGIRDISPSLRYKSGTRPGVDLGAVTEEAVGDQKSVEDIPGYGFLSSIYWYFIKGFHEKTHELQIVHKKKYGPIWKSSLGNNVVIHVANSDMIEEILRQEGKYPIRAQMPHWREYREIRGHAYGPLCEYGQEWNHMRSMLNPKLLKPKEVSNYSPAINKVVTDFMQKIHWLRQTQGGGLMVYDIATHLYNFAFEGICTILFETRMGCLEETIPEETQKFIAAVFEMFYTSSILPLLPKAMWQYIPIWKRFIAAWDYIFYISEKLINKKMKDIQEKMEKGLEVQGEYLTYLLTNTKMTPWDIYGSLSELLTAAVDTTSNTTSWILYNLAKEPSIQQQLYEEINSVIPGDQIPLTKDFSHMPLLKAVVKETLRLYPVVPGNARLVEKDLVIGGYHFPKNTLFHLCHYAVSLDDSSFVEPQRFQPERWLRDMTREKKPHPFASIPFGFGTRSCLGKRVAELEMYSVISRLIKHFEVRPDPSGKVVTTKTRTLLAPGGSIDLQFIDRM
uniref:25-hydroxyvitamin D-1 alpha hydroxylase 2 isoform 1 n=1 Tax=Potamotrygon motoro TaxID=86373 RepID=A0A5J6SE32_POTMO|nr:25-hydroxyvitamin D-1 alpha hydroxylase 2 isoform 1 [Potamotrygon motoro]QFF91473.1 25-hydroxyvitamin D-1 alpha hydroxylase 2 isoform 2 [Potamotrygon motoro]